MILYDKARHLVSDTSLEELHDFAIRIGIKRHWFDPNRNHPHYDIPKRMVELMPGTGASIVSSKEIVRRMVKQ